MKYKLKNTKEIYIGKYINTTTTSPIYHIALPLHYKTKVFEEELSSQLLKRFYKHTVFNFIEQNEENFHFKRLKEQENRITLN